MKGSKFLLAAIAEYQSVYPLALGVADDAPSTYEALKAEAATGSFPEDQRAFVLGHLNAWLEANH